MSEDKVGGLEAELATLVVATAKQLASGGEHERVIEAARHRGHEHARDEEPVTIARALKHEDPVTIAVNAVLLQVDGHHQDAIEPGLAHGPAEAQGL